MLAQPPHREQPVKVGVEARLCDAGSEIHLDFTLTNRSAATIKFYGSNTPWGHRNNGLTLIARPERGELADTTYLIQDPAFAIHELKR